MAISSPGLGSGLDVNGIVSQLVALERRPIEALQVRKTELTTQLSSFGLLQSYASNLQSAAGELAKPASWSKNTASSTAIDTVSATASATASAGSYRVEVTTLAAAQSVASAPQVGGSSTVMGTGTLNIQVGSGTAVAVEITTENQTLAGIRDAINAANAGVNASIVSDASGARLVLSSRTTGAANTITVTQEAGGSLAALTSGGGLSQIQAAADAAFTINGLGLTSATNTLTNVVDGLSMTLSRTTTTPVTINVGIDTAAMRKTVSDFVSAYNDIARFLAQQTNYDEATKAAGALQGDRTAVSLENKLRQMVQQASTASPQFRQLSDLGLELQRDGLLKLDESKLNTALQNPAAVSAAFTTAQTGFGPRFKALADAAVGAEGLLTTRAEGLRATIGRNERDQARYEERLVRIEERLLRQYAALDTSMAQLNNLSAYMNQQVTNWNKMNLYDSD